ncbi:hypothetical protein I4J31_04165 [Corynebacterium belfantii]|uniref:hypothetical protein n=1 Tax=Corynebacterium belfantii TaxID=2014537 RepID=UPI0018D2E519|nr:hypothetical protein [Corynebacterium belfantii]MBG9309915.1 hypothetical protein [Corynebacterium belfantii]
MARRQPSTNENQLSLFDMLQGTAESQPERRLTLTLTDIGGGAGIFISDEGKDRLNDHAKTLGNEELADAYFQAVRDFEEAGLEGSDRSHLIHNAYLAELSRRRLVRTQPRGLKPIAPPEGQPLSIVPWGTGPEQYHLARLELDPTGPVQAVVASLAQDYQTLLIKQLGLTQEEARHRYEAERGAITLSPGEIDQLTEETADLDTSTESTPHPDPVTFNPQNRLPIPQGVRGRAEANIAAIELLRQLETDQRWATADEQQVLAGYTSWGAASAIFNRADTSYTDLRERLAAVTTPDEYRRMEEATLTAFFTSDEIIRPLWSALTTAGYTDGPVLEPGSGTGNFLAHAPHTAEIVGVKIDPITASISRQLYPDAHIVNTGFERFQPIDESFVAAIGNVPFGDFRLHDPQHNPESHSIHNHFIVKSLNLVQPGGYVAVVTSSFTSDSLSSDARQDMIARADLVTATRLPAGAFRDVAGTDVGTDILVFRKRIDGEQPTDRSARFLEIDQMTLDDGTTLKVNGVPVDNPAAILGEASVARNRWGKPYLKVTGTGDDLETRLTDHLTREIERARGNQLALEARPATTAQQITESAADRESVTPGTIRYIDRDGKTQFQNFDASTGRWEDIKRTSGTDEAEWKALIDLRDTTTALRNAYRHRDESVDDLRNQLNEQYDSYVSSYGALNRFEHPKPKPPTKTQQSSRYNQLVAEWRAANGEGAPTQPPTDLAEQLRDDAAQPITPETKVLKHIGALRYDLHIYSLLAIEVFDEDTQNLIPVQGRYDGRHTVYRHIPQRFSLADVLLFQPDTTTTDEGSFDVRFEE